MLDLQWQREREGGREIENYLIEENFFREKFQGFFLDFITFFLWNVFLTKIIPDERISRPKSLPNKHVFRRHIYVKKTFKNDIPLGNSSNDCKNLYRN